MPDRTFQETREELARREVGHTQVGKGTAWVLALQFLLLVFCVPMSEVLLGGQESLAQRWERIWDAARTPVATEGSTWSRIAARNRAVIAALEDFENRVEDDSRLGRSLRPETQYALTSLGAGNEQAYIGRRPWLFFRQSFDYLATKDIQPEAVTAIVNLRDQLAARDIRLVVMPAPVKLSIAPEQFARRFEGGNGALRPAGFADFRQRLEESGVLVFDPLSILLDAKQSSTAPPYLMTDTHWLPQAGEWVAAGLRDFILENLSLPNVPSPGFTIQSTEVTNLGDIARLLDLPAGQTLYPEETVRARTIRTAEGALWRPSRTGDVLLLGDSFSNIYSQSEMGWGEGAGLAAQLSFLLDRPVDTLIQNADGAFATREALAREMGRGEDRLAGKHVVIFEFAERELAVGDWKVIDLPLGPSAPGDFFVPAPGEEVTVTGTIREIAPVPRPESVPYEDHITAIHLVDLASDREDVRGGQALVYLWGMRDRVLQEAAAFRPGDRITVRLRSWSDVAAQYEGISRTELENPDVQFETPTWGEVIN